MTEPAIRVSAVTKVFPTPFRRRRVVALRDLSLEIAPGEIYGLLGPNGSGKSTTLKIILGLIGPTRGSVRIFGRDNSAVAFARTLAKRCSGADANSRSRTVAFAIARQARPAAD